MTAIYKYINTDRYITQNGIKFPITFKYEFLESSIGHTIEMIILIPEGYEETELSEKGKFALLELIYFPLENELHLDNFFIYSQLYFKEAMKYEQEAFKGIGKLMLTHAIQLLINEYVKTKSLLFDMKITLKAEGGSIAKNYLPEHIFPYSKKYIIKYIEKRFANNENVKMLLKTESLANLRYIVSEYEENSKLVNYYIKLGFQIDEIVNGNSILMKGKLFNILNRCSNNKINDKYGLIL
jgi:hypothetical protein